MVTRSRRLGHGKSPWVAACIIALLGLIGAIGSAVWVEHRNTAMATARFDGLVTRVVAQIETRLARYEYGLRGARGAVISAGDTGLTREVFRRYSLSRNPEHEFPGARGFGFIRRVAADRETNFVKRARADGAPDFRVRQIEPHPGERFVIQYIEPIEQNLEAIGLDIASEEHRKTAAVASIETGWATLTAPITLVQATGLQKRGFLIFLPVYAADAPVATAEERHASAVGWTFTPLVIDEVLAGLDLDENNLGLTLKDSAYPAMTAFFTTADLTGQDRKGLQKVVRISLFGRTWELQAKAKPAFLSDLNLTPPGMAGSIIAIGSLLLSGLVYLQLSGRRRKIEVKVEKSRLAAIVAGSNDAIIAKTLDGTITDWNPAAERLFGYTTAEALGQKATDLILPPHLQLEEMQTLARIRQGVPVPHFETLRRRRDGTMLSMLVSVSPIRDRDGRPAGVAFTAHDITERVAAEDKIRALNATLEQQVAERTRQLQDSSVLQSAILTHAGYSVIATDTQGTITLFNPAAERMLGYRAEDLIGKATPGLFHDPDEIVERAAKLSAELGQPVAPGFEVFVSRTTRGLLNNEEWTYVTQHGDRLPVLLNISALRAQDGTDLGFLGIALDLTERYTHEAELKAANAGTWSYDVASGRIMMSAETARQHGLGDAAIEIEIETVWRSLAHPDDVTRTIDQLQTAIDTHGSYATEFRILRPDGEVRWIAAIGRVEGDANGTSRRAVGLTLDITARKEAELALSAAMVVADEARAEAERASQAKTDFLAAMSHEIRTPLNAIIGFTDLMVGSGRLDAGLQRQAELVRTSGAALLTVVNDILDFSKVEAGAIELEREPFPPRALVDNCVSIVKSLAQPKGVKVRTVIDVALPPGLIGDQARLRQVLLNLLNNAVKFTEAGVVTLGVRHEGMCAGGENLRFTVTDTGIGIPKEKQQRLFQRFSQVDNSIQRDYGGTGLGLAICKRLVELMGGEIGVISEDGQGSTFWFTVVLPRAFAQEHLSPVTSIPAARKQGRLLLVEDVAINQELAMAVLKAAGHEVDVVSDGGAAVTAVEKGGYDLVLMDVQMPGMDGMTATRMIRRLGSPKSRLPIIAMTANVLPDQVRKFRDAGMDDHVGKPFNRAELYATIDKWLPGEPVSQKTSEPSNVQRRSMTPLMKR